jgi:peptidoglycan/LPS O-acetylase OafA/YrhL
LNGHPVKEIRPLTGIRGVAALTVFLAHTLETLHEKGIDFSIPTLVKRLLLSGGRQVDIFFVLSGFILTLIYARLFDAGVDRNGYLQFMRKRLARIYPLQAFMLVLIVGFVLMATFSHAQVANGLQRFKWSTLPLNFLLIHAWGADVKGTGWNPPSWSISIEFLAYLLFPWFLWITASARKQRPWMVLIAALVCGFICNALMFWSQGGITGISRGLTEFALGCVCVAFFSSPIADWLRSSLGSTLAVCALLVCYALTAETSFAIAAFAAPLILALTGHNPVSRFFGWTPVYFLGEISYSIYLGHFLFSSISYRLVKVEWMRSGPLAAGLGLSFIIAFVLILSTVTYFAIERPGRDWLAGRRKGHPTAQVAVSL